MGRGSLVGRGGVLALALSRLGRLCRRRLPRLYRLTNRDVGSGSFEGDLREFLSLRPRTRDGPNGRVQLLVGCSKAGVRRLSAKRSVPMRALSMLRRFLVKRLRGASLTASLFVSLFCLFGELSTPRVPLPSPRQVGDHARH